MLDISFPMLSEWHVIRPDMDQMLAHLMTLKDENVFRVLTFLMADMRRMHDAELKAARRVGRMPTASALRSLMACAARSAHGLLTGC
ncbi:MAG: hypothetical protein ABJP33_06620 [Pseudoruegeria sp.]